MPTFPLSNEKLLTEDVKIISWCPTADLVLLVSPSNDILLYRNGINSIDLLWFKEKKINSNIHVVTWRPNGKEFVLGCENGVFYKVDITHHSPQISEYLVNTNISPITAFSWINYDFKKKKMQIEGFDPNAFDLEASLPTLSEESPAEPMSYIPRPKQRKSKLPPKPLQSTETQTLLFIGNKRGEVHIYLNGIYPIGFINIASNSESVSIINTSVAENIATLQVLAKPEGTSEEYSLCFLDTRILQLRIEEIFNISVMQREVKYLIDYVDVTINVLKRHHDSYTKATENVVHQASSIILKESATAMPEVELIGMLATGNVSAPIQELFAERLTSRRMKQWHTNSDHGYKNSQTVLCEHILPACERIQLALSKLLGYSLWKQRYGDFLEVDAVERCIESIQNLIIALNQFNESLVVAMKRFSAFIAWLTTVSQKVDASNSEELDPQPTYEDPELIAQYLNHDFTSDSLAEYFSGGENQTSNANLLVLLAKLTENCTEMLGKPSTTISTKIQVSYKLNFLLEGVTLDRQPRDRIVSISMENERDTKAEPSSQRTTSEDEHIIYPFVKFDPNLKLLLLKKSFDDKPLQYAQFDIDGIITDFEFFDQKELGILVQIDKETSKLQTISIDRVNFRNFSSDELISSELPTSREQGLTKMIGVKIGCNGLPRRRLFGLVASNGQLKVHYMDDDEDEDMDEDDEDE